MKEEHGGYSKQGSAVLENSMFLGEKKRRRRVKTIYHVEFGAARRESLGNART